MNTRAGATLSNYAKVHGAGVEPASLSAAEPKAYSEKQESRDIEETSPIDDPREPEIVPEQEVEGQSRGNGDLVEAALARALDAAVAAGAWATVSQLARELEERRLDARRERLGGVALIDDARRRGGKS